MAAEFAAPFPGAIRQAQDSPENPSEAAAANVDVTSAESLGASAPVQVGKASKHTFKIRRVPAIDGVRGLAVAAVVIYHYFGDFMPGGYLGVDLFFVLSGFLITSLLVRERAVTGRIDLKDFWVRRARRIIPAALFVMVIAVSAAGLVGGDAAVGLPAQFFGTLFFVNNWTQIAGSESYFADSGVQLLAHYWSLSVEEQFYVFWPVIVVALLAARRSFSDLARLSVVAAVASLAWMVINYDPNSDPTRVYYGTDTHAFGLLLGAALALWLTSTSQRADADSWPQRGKVLRDILGSRSQVFLIACLTLGGFVLLLFTMPDQAAFTYRGGLFLASLLAAGILFFVVRGVRPLTDIFQWAPLMWLGKVSLSLYLWHWPIIVLVNELFNRNGIPDSSLWRRLATVAALGVALWLSSWSFRRVETPIRRSGYRLWFHGVGERMRSGGIFRVAVPAGAAVMAIATVFSLATSPSMTRLEQELAAAAQLRQNAEAAERAELAKRKMPRGDQITAIGDSVMLASSEALLEEFPGIVIDAGVSRGYPAAPAIIEQMEQAGTLDPYVVLNLGINQSAAASGDELLDDILDSLGKERVIVMVLPYGDRVWMPESEREVISAARERENVYVADWCHAVRDDSSKLREDAIHPTPQGAVAFADVIRDAFEQYAKNKKRIPETCGL